MRRLLSVLLPALMLPSAFAAGQPGQFDYYVMALSWSPDYCAARPDDREQCSRQYGFVLHGLWPQYQRGYPADCSSERFDERMQQQFAGLYPSRKLYRHEWEKHGTCSGLTQQQFHQLAASIKARLVVPPAYQAPGQPLRKTVAALKADLQAANPWLAGNALAISCSGSGRFLKEVYVCTDKQGRQSQSCGDDVLAGERRSCRQPDILVRSVR
jgi:ribonuclease T2